QAARPRNTTVYWGGRRREDLYWDPPQVPWLRFVPVLSRADSSWAGSCGHVQDVMLAEHPRLADSLVYACGSDAMIRDAQSRLCAAGLPQSSFRCDAFVCSAPT
ncbi:MAG: CDP-6-deoxy-delta-3,4-glucoseen reductase, partial [Burkholderiales bacterium]|nr:CDP-6-deoxy-delta-3,4-glucoseen reductase [Burkholderiales bacterium]